MFAEAVYFNVLYNQTVSWRGKSISSPSLHYRPNLLFSTVANSSVFIITNILLFSDNKIKIYTPAGEHSGVSFLEPFFFWHTRNISSTLTCCCFKSYSFCWWDLGFGLGTCSEDYKEKVLRSRGQSVVSLHTLMRLWGWCGDWWSRVAETSLCLVPRGERRKDEDGELKAPQLCKCRSSWASFLGLPMIFCDCVINYEEDRSKTNTKLFSSLRHKCVCIYIYYLYFLYLWRVWFQN